MNDTLYDLSGDNETWIAPEELYSPTGKELSAVFGSVFAVLFVLAVVTLTSTAAYKARQERIKTYYSITKTLTVHPQPSDGRSPMRSNAGLVDLKHEQLSKSEGSMELVITKQSSTKVFSPSLSPSPPHSTGDKDKRPTATNKEASGANARALGAREDTSGSSAAVCLAKSEQFSFEDGTALHDYPASVDLELTNGEEPKKAKIMGYYDIYGSQILQSVSCTELLPHEKENTQYPGPQQERETAVATPHNMSGEGSSQPYTAPVLLIEGRRVSALGPEIQQQTSVGPSSNLKEVEDFLNQSLTDLLEMTRAMEAEMEDSNHNNDIASEHRSMRRQRSSLPTLLEPTHPHLPTAPPSSLPASNRASRGSNPDLTEVMTLEPAVNLDPRRQRTLLCSDGFTELQITPV